MTGSLILSVSGGIIFGFVSPMLKGSRLDGMLFTGFNAALIESLTVRYLPSFTDDTEYITTKKANSSVMKSA